MRDPFSKIGRKFKKKRLPQNAETRACRLPAFSPTVAKPYKTFFRYLHWMRQKIARGSLSYRSYSDLSKRSVLRDPFRTRSTSRSVSLAPSDRSFLFVERLTLFELLCFSRPLLYTDKPAMSNDLKYLRLSLLLFILLLRSHLAPIGISPMKGIILCRKNILSVC